MIYVYIVYTFFLSLISSFTRPFSHSVCSLQKLHKYAGYCSGMISFPVSLLSRVLPTAISSASRTNDAASRGSDN